jgi:CO/xanthine dehydrogenase FAD-binding subunit
MEEAYETLIKNKNNAILGGTAYIKMGNRHLNTAIDLSSLDLDFIREEGDNIEIGAMATFRAIETNDILKSNFNGLVALSVKDIVGVQLRNVVTAGATVFSKYGFSDFIPALLALDTKVVLFKRGEVSLEEFLQSDTEQDILEKIVIKKRPLKASFQTIRRSKSDYAILNVVVSKTDGDLKIAVGARPGRAVLAKNTMEILKNKELTTENIHMACETVAEELVFGDNMRATGKYRKAICKVMLKRALMEVK